MSLPLTFEAYSCRLPMNHYAERYECTLKRIFALVRLNHRTQTMEMYIH